MDFIVAENWKTSFPGARVGVLAMLGVENPLQHSGLEREKENLVAQLRARYAGMDRPALNELPILQAYNAYYRAFKKTYHVQLQLESIAFKGKTIPSVAGLVEAMFMAEVKNQLLTAGHDLDALRQPVSLDVTREGETYTLLRGTQQEVKPGDMRIGDREGIISSIIYGPDARTQIRSHTRNVLFTVYAPAGIPSDAVAAHLADIKNYVRLIAPAATVAYHEVFSAEG